MKLKIMKDKIIRLCKSLLLTTLFISIIAFLFYLKIYKGVKIVCVYHLLTHLYCPGCGLTRMLTAIMNHNFYQAFRWNPLLFIVLPLLIVVYMVEIIIYIFKGSFTERFLHILCWIACLLVVYGIIRNLSLFSWFMPTQIL